MSLVGPSSAGGALCVPHSHNPVTADPPKLGRSTAAGCFPDRLRIVIIRRVPVAFWFHETSTLVSAQQAVFGHSNFRTEVSLQGAPKRVVCWKVYDRSWRSYRSLYSLMRVTLSPGIPLLSTARCQPVNSSMLME